MDFSEAKSFIDRNDKFIITAHETPDGDALGSEYAMLRILRRLGKTAIIRNADAAPEKFRFVDAAGDFASLEDGSGLPDDLGAWALLVLDVIDVNNIGRIKDLVLPRVRDVFFIDHHEGGLDVHGPKLVDPHSSSTAEILYQLFGALGVEPDRDIAQALYMAIVYDTGSFVYPKTSALTFDIARRLVELGVNPNHVYANIYESNSISSLILMSRVMSTLELFFDDRVAVQIMTKEMVAESRGKYEEADQLINTPLRSKDIRISIFFKENLEGLMRCSMRSKGLIDVAAVAQERGGGGHRTAAGFKCRKPWQEVKLELLEVFKPYFDGRLARD